MVSAREDRKGLGVDKGERAPLPGLLSSFVALAVVVVVVVV